MAEEWEELLGPDPRARGDYKGLATEKGYSQEYGRIKKLRYSHEALIDMIISNPTMLQNEMALQFGYTVPWISRVIGSDSFQGALAKRREELTDPFLVASIEERFKGLINQSIDVIAEKLAATSNVDVALKALDISSKAMGFGARVRNETQVQNNFVVQLPGKAATADEWAKAYAGGPPMIEAQASMSTVDRDPTTPLSSVQLADD